ncbi:hypothetical protein [Haloferax denitrificans]|uniref:DUF8132 domain-containing protein n=1 Tax=Haloferax denitrificans ATCC 35960 TaxID=662478 RepID=M0J5J4_9EURY|nr:hypothetical protein [Haloferax denitrificans]EMA03608.1 hypothetical protein C438_13319 [Haloferax denitrificans ATCC 35960]
MRFRNDTRGIGVARLFFSLVTSVGLGLAAGTAFLIVRGPFFAGPSLAPFPMMAALAVFIVGIVVLMWGSTRLFGVGTGA